MSEHWGDRDRPSTSRDPYTSPRTVIGKLIAGDPEFTELSIVRDWLHSIPSSLHPVEIRRHYLMYTKNKLRSGLLGGQDRVPKGLVRHLDPDAVFRESADGRTVKLDSDDAVRPTSQQFLPPRGNA
jgi:hypothetical protein